MRYSIRKFLVCTVAFIVLLSGCGNSDTKEKAETKKEEKIELIKNSLYVEPKDPTNVQIKAFNKLSKAVESEALEEEANMTAVSFALDFFTLSNKTSNEDVGGLQFIPTAKIFRFKEYSQAYYYSNYGTIKNTYSASSLPEVTGYKTKSIEAIQTTYNGNPCDGYEVTLSLRYGESEVAKKDLKTEVVITVIAMADYSFDRSKKYLDETDFTGDKLNVYRVLTLE